MSCVLILAGVAVGPASASGPGFTGAGWGAKWLQYGNCCSGAKLQGTRASIAADTYSTDEYHCLIYSSVVEEINASRQLEEGLARCGDLSGGIGIDQFICPDTTGLEKFVETIANSIQSCWFQGYASGYTYYKMSLRQNTSGSSTWYAAIDNQQTGETLGGFDDNVYIFEWGEHSGNVGCTLTWSGLAAFSTWQRYNFALGSWYTIQQSESYANPCTSGSGWSVSPLYYYSYDDTNSFTVQR